MTILDQAWPEGEPRRRNARRRAKAISRRIARVTSPLAREVTPLSLRDQVVGRTIAGYNAVPLRVHYPLPDARPAFRFFASLAAALDEAARGA
jgi:hypothetical protein